jgi:ribosome-associated toxin RatA of RatAB toxin-antitoxin module
MAISHYFRLAGNQTQSAVASALMLLMGPLRYLSLSGTSSSRDEYHTQLQFSVDYEFDNPVLAAVASRVFGAMFGEILNAFERRAAHLFTNRTSAGSTRGG